MRSRFAPSPTGDLHLGGAFTAVCAWARCRAARGQFLVRIEDLDQPRTVVGSAANILNDMRFLGIDWDEGPEVGGPHAPYLQSERANIYQSALNVLRAKGVTYECDCSRAEIARVASAPHAGEDGPRYPGFCRDREPRQNRRPPAIRLAVPKGVTSFHDVVRGTLTENVHEITGDFALLRSDGVASYQLAVVVDDAEMRINEVVRGDDLLPSTARQVLLWELLFGPESPCPTYCHVPMVLGPDGERLAKRQQRSYCGTTIHELRAMGVPAAEILGEIACGLGWIDQATPIEAGKLVDTVRTYGGTFAAHNWVVPARWVRPREP